MVHFVSINALFLLGMGKKQHCVLSVKVKLEWSAAGNKHFWFHRPEVSGFFEGFFGLK